MKKVLVVGDAMIDRNWYCTPKNISQEAPLINWDVDSIKDFLGGSANVVRNLVSLGQAGNIQLDVSFISKVPWYIKTEVDKEYVLKNSIVSFESPIVKNRIIFSNPYRQIIRFDENPNNKLSKEEEDRIVKKIKAKQFDIGLVSDYSYGGVTSRILEAVRASCKLVVIDPKGTDYLKYVGIAEAVTPNLKELNDLSLNKLDNTADKIIALAYALQGNQENPTTIILKKGNKGCTYWSYEEGFISFEPFKTEMPCIDPTGAGDTFIATLVYYLSENKTWMESVFQANSLAGISVTHPNCWIPGGLDA
jgi:rfaE bifunctional protein kinase chain/domain